VCGVCVCVVCVWCVVWCVCVCVCQLEDLMKLPSLFAPLEMFLPMVM